MKNFQIHFSYPWLLLLLIPALLFTILPYFRLNKRYRRTRNRITSMVLRAVVFVLSIATLSGFVINYQVPNEQNEIILLVDKSESEEQSQETRDEFVKAVLDDGKYDDFNIGIVTFGYDQRYVLPLTDDLDDAYNTYLGADLPDISATNVAAALTYAKSLFTNPEMGKIVLVTDGKETDEEANQVIRSVSAQGISVDVAFVPSFYEGNDVQIIGATLPDYHVAVGDQCEISVTLQSSGKQDFYVGLFDNEEIDSYEGIKLVSMEPGTQTVAFNHSFASEGLHEIRFRISSIEDDAVEYNNEYCTYHYLEVFNKILIVERAAGESDALVSMLNSDPEMQYEIDVVGTLEDEMPKTVDELRNYDQVILNNIANADMPLGFDEILSLYVEEYGGGLFTVGGNDETGEANAYNRSDMYGTLYQDMLPVQAINYTPPVGVMVIIDRSGSMDGSDDRGHSFLEGAKAGAIACLDALYERDYIGIMTLDSDHNVVLDLTSRTQETKIREAVNSIETADGNTIFAGAINRAGQALRGLKNVAKRHMIIVTDGMTSQPETYEPLIENFYNSDGITLSIIGVNMTLNSEAATMMQNAVDLGHGRLHIAKSTKDLVTMMREDLNAPEIKDVNEEEFKPIIYNATSPLVQNLEVGEGEERNRLTVELGGFYGVKKKEGTDLILVGDYEVPIYAQWKYGKGTVGSFMCDLQNSSWSSAFMSDINGQKFIRNAVNNLMPVENIRPSSLSVVLKEDNYTNTMSILADLQNGEKVVGEISRETDSGTVTVSFDEVTKLNSSEELPAFYVTTALSAENNYSRCGFVVKESGVYKITLKKVDEDGKVLDEQIIYKAFAYSEEYDSFDEASEDDIRSAMATLADKGNGSLIEDLEDPRSIFEEFVTALDRTYDPRTLFMILAIVLFLTDIAVRKFKFKWPHEIIRDYKKKKTLK